MKNFSLADTAVVAFAALTLAGCRPAVPSGYQGYIEGEFVHIAAPVAGRLETLAVAKGTRVAAGAPLFALERRAELATQQEAAGRVRAAQARLGDLRKGLRPSELASVDARLEQTRAAAELSKRELARQESLFQTAAISANDLDRARLTHDRNARAIEELVAQAATARLGARPDAIVAAEAEVAAAGAAQARADWSVDQKNQTAPADALVYDTLYRPGEFVPVGAPVVSLLPPANLKVRFFVPERDYAALKTGDAVRVSFSGGNTRDARVQYLSPKPEYTPPILYNRDNRAKLVFMVEAVFTADVARDLHPGQPVDVARTP